MYMAVSIGNTDNRLTQQEWSQFVSEINNALSRAGKIHFFGGAPNWERWQNVAWIAELDKSVVECSARISEIREKYKQDSAFVLFGEGIFT